jgi:hypothetical protein
MAPFAQKRLLAHLNPEKHAGGRPSEYKPEYCQAVIDKMEQGLSLAAFAGSIKVARDTVYAWMHEHSEFSDAVARARSTRVLWLERKLLASRKGAETTAAIFALRNADPSEWRDVRNVQHDHSHTIANLTDEQLLAIASGRASDVTVIEHDDHALPSSRDAK